MAGGREDRHPGGAEGSPGAGRAGRGPVEGSWKGQDTGAERTARGGREIREGAAPSAPDGVLSEASLSRSRRGVDEKDCGGGLEAVAAADVIQPFPCLGRE